jgi:hypothetical protein
VTSRRAAVLIGPDGYVAERLAAFRQADVTTLNVTSLAATHAARAADIERVRDLASQPSRSVVAGTSPSRASEYAIGQAEKRLGRASRHH